MSEEYRVILTGYEPNKGEYYIELDYGKLFDLTQAQAKQLFKNLPHTVAEGISKAEAEILKEKINGAGAKCEIEDARFNISHLSLL